MMMIGLEVLEMRRDVFVEFVFVEVDVGIRIVGVLITVLLKIKFSLFLVI